MTAAALRGLYAITSAALCREPAVLLAGVEAALRGGARLIQYRDKQAAADTLASNASALLLLCRRYRVPLIVNDDAELAAAIGADGVHLGASDGAAAAARARLGPHAIIGISCSDSLERARAAQAAGADYLAFGRFHPSMTKPDAPPASLQLLHAARAEFGLPICAIGGVTPGNASALIAAGADMVAAVEGVFGSGDIETVARAYTRLFD